MGSQPLPDMLFPLIEVEVLDPLLVKSDLHMSIGDLQETQDLLTTKSLQTLDCTEIQSTTKVFRP